MLFSAVARVCAIVIGLSFLERGIYSVNFFPGFFSSLTGRTLDTTEGKPGSLRQTAEEVNSFVQSITCVDIVVGR